VVFQAVGAVSISVLQDKVLRWRLALFNASHWTNSRSQAVLRNSILPLCINYLGLYIMHLTHFCKACKIDYQYNFVVFVYCVYSETMCISGAVLLTFCMSVWNLNSQMCCFYVCDIMNFVDCKGLQYCP
jgi:hypothetical protein